MRVIRIISSLAVLAATETRRPLVQRTRSIVMTGVAGFLLAACAGGPELKNRKAAEAHAVALANDRCQQVFGERPFQPGQFQVALVERRWQWGQQDPAGIQGYSAIVSFRPDRSDPLVEVFFSHDEAPIGGLEKDPPEADGPTIRKQEDLPPDQVPQDLR